MQHQVDSIEMRMLKNFAEFLRGDTVISRTIRAL